MSRPRLGAEYEAGDIADRAAVDGDGRPDPRAPSRPFTCWSTAPASSLSGTFVGGAPRAGRAVLAVNYLGGVWMTRGLLAGCERRERTDARTSSTSPRSAASIVFTPAAPYSASKHAQVAFSRSLPRRLPRVPESRCTRSCPGFVTTPGFPHPTDSSHTGSAGSSSSAPSASRREVLSRGRAGQGGGRRSVVPVPARRDRAGDAADADGPGALKRDADD